MNHIDVIPVGGHDVLIVDVHALVSDDGDLLDEQNTSGKLVL